MATADQLALLQTILAGISLLAIIFAVVALCIERVRRVRGNDERRPTTNATLMGCLGNQPVSVLQSLLGAHSPILALPSIEGLIEAADRGYWTSTTLDHLPDVHPELTWIPLYESVLDDVRRAIDLGEGIGTGSPHVWTTIQPMASIFQNMARPRHRNHRPEELVRRRQELVSGHILANCARQLPSTDTPLKSPSNSTSHGLARIKSTWMVQRKPCIPVTREELVALCLVMGISIAKSHNGLYFSGIGAHGLSIDLTHTESTWKLTLGKGSRISRHAPSMGSGYTSLMAKHLACGSVPFAESVDWVRSVYVTDDVLEGVKRGVNVQDTRAYGGASLEFLRRLPGDKAIDAYYGLAEVSSEGSASSSVSGSGSILDAGSTQVGRWARAVAGVAFGGLVPQAAPNVVEAVRFTVAGQVDECVQNLESLIDCLHRAHPQAKMFGQRVAERTAAMGHTYVNHVQPSTARNPRDAASTFARYMNLLERVVVLCDDSLPVGQGGKGANGTTVTAHGSRTNAPASTADTAVERVFEATVALLERVYKAAVRAERARVTPGSVAALTAEENELLNQNLSAALHSIESALDASSRIPVQSASVVVRCILAAWADTVPIVLAEEHVGDLLETSNTKTRAEVLFMDELPSIMALG